MALVEGFERSPIAATNERDEALVRGKPQPNERARFDDTIPVGQPIFSLYPSGSTSLKVLVPAHAFKS